MNVERRIGQFIGLLAIAALLGVIWGIFLGGTLWALAELGAIDSNHTVVRAAALTWIYLAMFSVITAATHVGASINRKISGPDLVLSQLRNALQEREAQLGSDTGARH